MADDNESDAITTLAEPATEIPAETAEPGDLLSRLSLILGLSAIFLALADIAAIIIVRAGNMSPPSWVFQAQRLVPQVGIILAAAGVGLNLIGAWHLLARHHLFDPKETQQDLAIDDLSGLLSRIHPGCAVRVATSSGLVATVLAILLSIWAVPFGDHFRVIAVNSAQTCSVSGTLAPFSIELDNSTSTSSVSWSATPVETVADGADWAQITPAHGRLAAGQEQRISVFANAMVCYAGAPTAGVGAHSSGALALLATAPSFSAYHVRISTSETSSSDEILALSVLTQLASTGSPVPTATALPSASPTPKPTPTTRPVVVPTPTRVVISPTATATPVPPTATPCPGLTASITKPTSGPISSENMSTVTIEFVGTSSGGCGAIPTSDITWSVYNAHYFPTTTIMGDGDSITYTLPAPLGTPAVYNITFKVYDPTSGQTASASVSISVIEVLG